MLYKELYKESNELEKERFVLVRERVAEIEEKPETEEKYKEYFRQTAQLLQKQAAVYDLWADDAIQKQSLKEAERCNQALYKDILGEAYQTSYANPDYAVEQLGEEFGQLLCAYLAYIRRETGAAFRGDLMQLTIQMELFVEIYNRFEAGEEKDVPEKSAVQQDLYWFFHDYSEIFYEKSLRRLIDPAEDFENDIVMNADLNDLRYLYRYGVYIGENEKKMAAFLNRLTDEEIQAMADTYTEGYRIGFEAGNKDITKKKIVNIRYSLGFERMIRRAVQNFRKIGLEATIYRATTSVLEGRGMSRIGYYGGIPNKQYDFDHKDDQALILDKALLQVRLEALREAYEEYKEQAGTFGGPAVVEVFGERSVELVSQKQALHLSKEQQQMLVEYAASAGELQNNYIHGEERSFTIIAFPVPEIASGQEDGKEGKDRYPEIFDAVIRINTLDYQLYQRIQQKIIDVLDRGKYVMVKGMNGNRTNMKVMLHTLQNPDRETNFENCVADVNIPVGEVFTSPVLTGTEGTLHVSHVYLDELEYKDLILRFEDGRVTDYSCANFTAEEENRKLIKDNILFHHETLPIGEFAIGTNTTAFVAARKYHIEDKLPILIAEKTGPHFAVGDTCYSHSEEVRLFNPDGKEIIAKDNECSIKRKEDSHKAYFNCHTDITIPYDELGEVSVVTMTEEVIPIIEEGRFVLAGCEELNAPFDQESMD